MKLWSSEKVQELERRIIVNDVFYNTQFRYANNYIKTSKYNVITFTPKNLFEQFQRVANAYFLILLILQLIPQISSLTWTTTAIPLFFVLAVTSIKDGYDDFQRYRSDHQVNNRKASVLRGGFLIEEQWHRVVVGDIIRMTCDQFIAADLLLLSTSEPNSLSYIETAELDGETNLKVKQALPETAVMGEDLANLSSFNAEIICEPPNNRLMRFEGTMKWSNARYSLDNEKILLRGCVLRNTKWAYGVVIFAGKDTKLMMNSGKAIFKRTHIDRLMNLLIIGIFMFLLLIGFICMVACGIWEKYVGYMFQAYLYWENFVPSSKVEGATDPDGSPEAGAAVIALLNFLSYIIILNTVVPISLYVSVEMLRIGNSLWINWDEKMYDPVSDTPAKVRTTTLNEELGQIEYIFSDKTGTLTQNVMTFNKCCVDGRSYGDPTDCDGNVVEITPKTPKVSFEGNPYAEASFNFYDQDLLDGVRVRNDENVHCFFRLLALCHTVMPEERDDGNIEYQAQSPDEGALVSAAKNFGFVFKSRTPTTITIEVLGQTEVYELLCILDFNNFRKRMSVILRKDGVITLYCKGADSVIYERLAASNSEMKELTTHHLNEFAQTGLRTLCLARKEIDPDVYEKWRTRHHEASCAQDDREDKVAAMYEEIEKDLMLIGATAIEDKLQDGVPECIANLALAGMKIWVLTGDKQETAVNIGYSSQLLTDEMEEIFVVDSEQMEGVRQQLQDACKRLHESGNKHLSDVQFQNGAVHRNESLDSFNEDMSNECALVINGHSLAHALKAECKLLFLEVGCLCKAVICCRVTPLQKALVVQLVKDHKKSITLSIGDGANDVSMIKTAQIGVGISGQEGLQAVLASDYSIAQFRFLERLLLVQGRWSYLRMCKFLKYFFYKNIAFTLCQFWYAFFCGFSAQALYDPYFISFYNLFFTSLPVLAMGIFDQDVNENYSTRYPKLYTPGLLDLLFNKRVFLWSVVEGIFASMALFFIPYGAYHKATESRGHETVDQQSFGVVIASTLVVAMNLRVAMDTSYWSGFNHFVIWGSMVFYFGFIIIFYLPVFGYAYVGAAEHVFSTGQFWFTLFVTNAVILLPIVIYRFYEYRVNPSLTDRVRFRQRLHRLKTKSRDNMPRRMSTMRRSTRSLRSGYAFAHSEGFGHLITSGANMRARYDPTQSLSVTPRSPIHNSFNSPKVSEGLAIDNDSVKFLGMTRIDSHKKLEPKVSYVL